VNSNRTNFDVPQIFEAIRLFLPLYRHAFGFHANPTLMHLIHVVKLNNQPNKTYHMHVGHCKWQFIDKINLSNNDKSENLCKHDSLCNDKDPYNNDINFQEVQECLAHLYLLCYIFVINSLCYKN
jgi:hypothetical protein